MPALVLGWKACRTPLSTDLGSCVKISTQAYILEKLLGSSQACCSFSILDNDNTDPCDPHTPQKKKDGSLGLCGEQLNLEVGGPRRPPRGMIWMLTSEEQQGLDQDSGMGSQNDPRLVPESQYAGMRERTASGLGRYAEQAPRSAPVMPWSMSPWVHRIRRCSWVHTSVTDDIYIIHCMLWPHLFTAAPLAGLVLS